MREDHLLYLVATYGLALLMFIVETGLTVRRHRRALRAQEEEV